MGAVLWSAAAVVALVVLFASFVKVGEAHGRAVIGWNVARVLSVLVIVAWIVLYLPGLWM